MLLIPHPAPDSEVGSPVAEAGGNKLVMVLVLVDARGGPRSANQSAWLFKALLLERAPHPPCAAALLAARPTPLRLFFFFSETCAGGLSMYPNLMSAFDNALPRSTWLSSKQALVSSMLKRCHHNKLINFYREQTHLHLVKLYATIVSFPGPFLQG
mmetsp:Transcript_10190/g.22193  ORF Transcript_10190/g.22193 Transcript_10190/m.22193 type:complete len:156 (+) Transcript_10190:2425-2892(+)